nr:copia protein [Tanacetum cinerariifolium]
MASDYDNPDPVPQRQDVYSSADADVPSQQELDMLFGPLYDEFFNAGSNPSTNVQSTSAPSTHKNVHAEENNNDQAEEGEQVQDDEFTNPFCAPAQEEAESSSQNIDADHAGCIDSRKSTSGGIQFLGDKLVSWMSKKQNCTAMSSAEAKYVALSASYAQVMWMRTQLQDYGFNYNEIPLTEYQLADMFTKALPEERFKYLVRRIGMRCLNPAELEVLAKESA